MTNLLCRPVRCLRTSLGLLALLLLPVLAPAAAAGPSDAARLEPLALAAEAPPARIGEPFELTVVKQRGGGGCQFSYVCDGRKKMRERDAADLAGRIARAMLDGAPRLLTDGATHFHTRHVRPGWSKRFAHTTSIGAHLFYRQPSPRG